MEFNTAGLISLQDALDKMHGHIASKAPPEAERATLCTSSGSIME